MPNCFRIAKNIPKKLVLVNINSMQEKVFYKNSTGQKMCGVISNNTDSTEKPIVIVSHGFTSSKDTKSWGDLVEKLNNQDVATFRLDLFAHGESEGKLEDVTVSKAVDGILKAIELVKNRGYQKIGLLGSSFGGISSIMAASKFPEVIFLALRCPVCDYKEELIKSLGLEKIKEWKEKGIAEIEDAGQLHKLKYSLYEDIQNNEPYKVAEKINCPVFIVHGDHDTCVPITQSRKFIKLVKNGKLHEIAGADHWFPEGPQRNEMVEKMYEFITKQIRTRG